MNDKYIYIYKFSLYVIRVIRDDKDAAVDISAINTVWVIGHAGSLGKFPATRDSKSSKGVAQVHSLLLVSSDDHIIFLIA